MLDDTQTAKLIGTIKIPPAPFILLKLQEELRKTEPALMAIADLISQDVGMSGLVLRTVNSPFFGLRAKVRSIQHATSLLGIRYTANIVAGLALKRTFEEAGGPNPPNFWDSPSNTAMAAADIARRISRGPPDEAYMLGLFHNSGHALLMQRFADYREFHTASVNLEDGLITELEDRRYNTDHATLGSMLARSWGLEPQITAVIREHHNVVERLKTLGPAVNTEGTLLCILKMAEHVDKGFWGLEPDHEWSRIQASVLDYVGLSEPDFNDLRDDLKEKLISG